MGKNISLLIGVAMLCVGCLLSVIALSIYGWAKADDTPKTILSLWRVCVTIGSEEVCDEIEDVSGSLNATRRMLIGAVINNGIATCVAIFFMLKTKMTGVFQSRSMVLTTLCTGLFSVVLTVAAVATYGATYEDDYGDRFKLARAFHICIASGVCILNGCITVFCSFKKGQIEQDRMITTTTTVMHGYPPPHQGPAVVYGNPPPPYGTPGYPAYGQPGGPPGYPAPYGPKDPAYPPPPAMAY